MATLDREIAFREGLARSATELRHTIGDGSMWNSHPKHDVSDWRDEVDNADTVLGYWEWAAARENDDEFLPDEEEETLPQNDEWDGPEKVELHCQRCGAEEAGYTVRDSGYDRLCFACCVSMTGR
jgi:hypothetical protein